MIINKVVINNFYCFLDSNVIEFDKGLNIISALNSGGKSQLFNAFYWTFFDKIYADNNAGKKEWKSSSTIIVCPDKLRVDSKEDEKITSSIEITLTAEYHLNDEPQDDLVTYTFLKKVTYEKSGNNISVYSKPELVISFVKEGETEFIPSQQHSWFLERIFPSSIRKFMWYQGESMDELYDFSNPSTLKNAIKEISYFPMYDNMERIVKAASASIDKKIEKELSLQNKLNTNQQSLINKINADSRTIENKEAQVTALKSEIDALQDDIADIEHKLKGYDKYRDIKEQLVSLQSELALTKSRIEDSDVYIKETLINKWMLNGCEGLINASEKNLNILNKEIQEFQQTNNPVPLSLPGPEYIEKMLADNTCYICEREVIENTAPYEALKKRLYDFECNLNHKILQDNYTELNRARKRLISELPDIEDEISANNKKREDLIKKRNSLNKKINTIFENPGQEDAGNIMAGATTATQMLAKIQSFRNSINTKSKTLNYLVSEIEDLKNELNKAKNERDKILKSVDTNIVESEASYYIKMFVKSIGKLRSIAYDKLIKEIQEESNRLYSLYLGGRPQGEIVIDKGIRIVDKATKEVLSELNTAELVAQKLAVANAFLSLSEKKMKRSYPIVADAPTSDFDSDNTYNLTINIGDSFDQMIIMSKDYASLKDAKRDELIKAAKIVKFYEFKNEKIDNEGADSRTNRKTFINTIK
jgi:DNA sulfur modification protein DndD